MKLYRKICFVVEDFFIKFLSRKQDEFLIQEKVQLYRENKRLISKSKIR